MGVHLDSEKIESFKDIARKERRKIKEIHKELIEDYIKKHGDGNPAYTLDHYNDENFLATPAYHRPKLAWRSYLTKCTDKEYKEWVRQLEFFMNLEREMTRIR